MHGSQWAFIDGVEGARVRVVVVEVGAESGVPELSLTGEVEQEAVREVEVGDCVVMCTDYCIIRMATHGRVGDGS